MVVPGVVQVAQAVVAAPAGDAQLRDEVAGGRQGAAEHRQGVRAAGQGDVVVEPEQGEHVPVVRLVAPEPRRVGVLLEAQQPVLDVHAPRPARGERQEERGECVVGGLPPPRLAGRPGEPREQAQRLALSHHREPRRGQRLGVAVQPEREAVGVEPGVAAQDPPIDQALGVADRPVEIGPVPGEPVGVVQQDAVLRLAHRMVVEPPVAQRHAHAARVVGARVRQGHGGRLGIGTAPGAPAG